MHRPPSEWSLEDALALDDYAAAGDINTAIGNIAAQAQAQRQGADEAVAAATYSYSTSDSSQRLEAYLYPNDQRDATRWADFQTWARAHHQTASILLHAPGPNFETLRNQYLTEKNVQR
jgi:hypothetical protein